MHTVIVYGQSLINAYTDKVKSNQMLIRTKLYQSIYGHGQS